MAEPTSTPQIPTYTMFDATDSKGADVVIYDTTGKKQTEASFSTAIDTYNKSGTAPKGFVVLKPGATNDIRQMFETGNKYLQQGAQNIANRPDLPVLPSVGTGPNGEAQPQMGYGLPGAIYNSAKGMAPVLADQVSTLPKLGMTLGLGAAAPLLKGASVAAEGGGVALSKANVFWNMVKSGIGGATGAAIGRAVGGEGFDPGKTAVEFGLSSMAGGFPSVLGHWINRFISPDKQEGVAKEILDSIVKQYPNMANNPALLQSYVESQKGLQSITQQMSKALRGTLDDVTDNVVGDIKAVLPSGQLTTGQQHTLNANVRKITQLGNDYLDNITNSSKAGVIRDDMLKAQETLIDSLQKFYPTIKDFGPTEQRLITTLTQHNTQLDTFKQGAEVLGYLQKSGAAGGYSHEAFSKVINDKYLRNPGSLLEHVGDILGRGGPLIGPDAQVSQQPPSLMRGLITLLKDRTPLKYLPITDKPQPAMLPWRTPQGQGVIPTMMEQQGFVGGADAIKSYNERGNNK